MEALTNVHCTVRHRMTKNEFLARHGSPKYVTPRMDSEVQRWIRDAQVIRRLDFDMAQAAARTLFRRGTTHA
ncbi:hypothetical protein GCM10025857_08270 [Alicyclobacillus contaminans]|nr:hypothetical protein GCM10025857_08270 [Alicyclobacillus contaminans]